MWQPRIIWKDHPRPLFCVHGKGTRSWHGPFCRGGRWEPPSVLVIILAVCLLVVDMLNVFSLVSGMGFSAYMVGVSKAFVYLTRCTLDEFVPDRFNMYSAYYWFVITLNLDKDMGPHPAMWPTSLMFVLMFYASGQHHLYKFRPRCQCPCFVGHWVGQWHNDGG